MRSKEAMTLDRVLSRYGIGSRTAAREAIRAGRLKVNGKTVRNPDLWVEPQRDAIHLDGERLRKARRVYMALYKPKGVITSHGDPEDRATVYGLLGDRAAWVSPVGRLDKDTSGLLLLSNDTDFSHLVTDPASGIRKTYMAKINGLVPDEVLGRLSAGVQMRRGDWARPVSVSRIEDRGKYSRLQIVLCEGKNREVRRMLEAVGYNVLKLVRTAIGPVSLAGLQVGQWRELTRAEVVHLLAAGRQSLQSPPPGPPGLKTLDKK